MYTKVILATFAAAVAIAQNAPASQIPDGQVQASSAVPVSQISDGQPQAPTSAPVVSQISDGQPQAPTSAPVVSQIPDGQPQAPTGLLPKPQNTTSVYPIPSPTKIPTGGASLFSWSASVAGVAGIAALAALL